MTRGNGDVYVTNAGSKTVSVITTTIFPSQTTITSATDGNGQPIQNGGSTLSTSITFYVTAKQGTNPISGFQCSLDSGAFNSCAIINDV